MNRNSYFAWKNYSAVTSRPKCVTTPKHAATPRLNVQINLAYNLESVTVKTTFKFHLLENGQPHHFRQSLTKTSLPWYKAQDHTAGIGTPRILLQFRYVAYCQEVRRSCCMLCWWPLQLYQILDHRFFKSYLYSFPFRSSHCAAPEWMTEGTNLTHGFTEQLYERSKNWTIRRFIPHLAPSREFHNLRYSCS